MPKTKLGKVSLSPKGAWDASTAYEQLDMVSYDGGSWLAKKSSINITPADGDYWMSVAKSAVSDVQLDGESIVTNKVATIPVYKTIFDGVKLGIYQLSPNSDMTGITLSNSCLALNPATESRIKSRTGVFALTSTNYDLAVKHAMTDGVGMVWTDDEQKAARQKMGIITCTQEEYNLIAEPSESTIYVIVG